MSLDYSCYEASYDSFTCAICGYLITAGEKHDPRPIISERGEFCCSECNEEVVIPTRKKVWAADDEEDYYKSLSINNRIRWLDVVVESKEDRGKWEFKENEKGIW